MDVTSSTAGAAMALKQAQGQMNFGVKALNQNAEQQQATVEALMQSAGGSGGNVTPTRGQNLNITV
ncbi:putative motility protein [Azospirillum sp. 412522]|nr:putative motility protein [Azospirillum sp. 412522]MBY6264561.1 putative motility protein [Azospirillum sp. 412522]